MAVSGSHAYVASGNAGLLVIDISDPANPRNVGRYLATGNPQSVAVSGDFAYLTGFQMGLEVFDIRDPTRVLRVGGYDLIDGARRLSVAGKFAYLLTWNEGLQVIEISDPANPRKVGEYRAGNGAVAVAGNFAYLAYQSGLAVLDISQGGNPQLLGGYASPSDPRDVVFFGDYACVADGGAGLELFDLSHPAGPQRVGGYFIGAPAESVATAESHAFVAAGNELLVIDLSSPVKPRRVGRYAGEGRVVDVAVSGQHAYLAEHPRWDGTNEVGGGLQVIDVSDPTSPQRGGGFRTRGYANSIALSGGYAYLADGRNTQSYIQGEGLVVIDIHDPANPQRKGAYETAADARGVAAVSANRVCLTAMSRYDGTNWVGGGLHVIDFSDPANPRRVGGYAPPDYNGGYIGEVIVSGDYAFAARPMDVSLEILPGPLDVIDISNPAQPLPVGRYPGFVPGVAVRDNVAWVAERFIVPIVHGHVIVGARLQAIDIRKPANPLRFEPLAREVSGALRLRMAGPPGIPGRVQRSTDLRAWTDWLPVNFGENPGEVSDPDAAFVPAGFYRIAVP